MRSLNKISKQEREKLREEKAEDEYRKEQEILLEKQTIDIKKYNIRRIILNDTIKFFESIQKNANQKLKREYNINKWMKYISCDNVPDAYDPPEIRKHLIKWDKIQSKMTHPINWLLQCEERCLLSQEPDTYNCTRKYIESSQPVMGEIILKKLKEIILLHDDIEYYLTLNYNKLNQPLLKDLKKLKNNIRERINKILNSYTYEILSNIERDMKPLNAISSNYEFHSNVFSINLWTPRDVPQPPYLKDEKRNVIKFPFMNMYISIPINLHLKQAALRLLWLNFDHCSDNASTYKIHSEVEEIGDMKLSNQIDWERRVQMKNELLRNMKQKQQYHQEINNQRNKPIQETKLNFLNENTIVNIDNIFNRNEEELYANKIIKFRESMINIDCTEINLRSHQICGGTIHINYFECPLQPTVSFAEHRSISIVTDKLKSIPYYKKIEHNVHDNVRISNNKSLNSVLKQTISNDIENNLIEITINLPNSIYWWQEPIVCRWEPWEESDEFNSLSSIQKYYHIHCNEIMEKMSKKLYSSSFSKKRRSSKMLKSIPDFNLHNIPSDIKFYYIAVDHILPRISSNHKFLKEIMEDHFVSEKRKVKNKAIAEIVVTEKQTNFDEQQLSNTPPGNLFVKLKSVESLKYLFKKQSTPTIKNRYESKEKLLKIENSCNTKNNESILIQIMMLSTYLKQLKEVELRSQQFSDQRNATLIPMDSLLQNDSTKNISKSLNKVKKLIPKHAKGKWSTRDVYFQSYDSINNTITFKLGTFGIFGLASFKYCNHPLLNWELSPHSKHNDCIVLKIIGQYFDIAIRISNFGYIIENIKPIVNNLICLDNDITLINLKMMMINSGINIFPELDAICFIKDISEKYMPLEIHIYKSMATFCLTNTFKWCSWNKLANRRTVIILCQQTVDENEDVKQFEEILITPEECYSVAIEKIQTKTDNSQIPFKYTLVPEMQDYNPDLYSYLKFAKHMSSTKQLQENVKNYNLIWNVSELLKAIKPLSFSI